MGIKVGMKTESKFTKCKINQKNNSQKAKLTKSRTSKKIIIKQLKGTTCILNVDHFKVNPHKNVI